MASTGQVEINKLTPDNGAITDLRELIFLERLDGGAISDTFTLYPGAIDGKKVGLVGRMGLVGENQNDCKPVWNATNIPFHEKEWELGEWTISERICYKDLKDTLVRYAMRKKTSVSDLTSTDYMDVIVEPLLSEAIDDMFWRLYWFGDKQAANVSGGGLITNKFDPKYFQVTDGFFKRLFEITTNNPKQRAVIAANDAATYAEQRNQLRVAGVAMGIMDDLVYNSDPRLRQLTDKVILTTQSLADAVAIDAKKITGSDLQWESLFDGLISSTRFNGQEIIALPKWDETIAAYEDNGTTLNKPHRALYTSRKNLLAGIASDNMIAELDIFFSKDDQDNKIIARDEIGTLILENDMLRFAH